MLRFMLTVLALNLYGYSAAQAADVMQYRYWDWGQTSRRDDYQFAVLGLALDKTNAEFGPYQLTRVVRNFSTLRSRREVAAGVITNVRAGPWRPVGREEPLERSIPIEIPIMSNLLGTRALLIRRADLDRFASIDRVDQLKVMDAGQGNSWVEVEMYRRAGFQVVDSGNINTLLAMLANKRFDYLPMSIIEISSALARHPTLAPQLAVAPGILLSYPLPVIFHVSARHPELARRLQRGLTLARKDGSMDALMLSSFGAEIAEARRARHVFRVPNPVVPARLVSDILPEGRP